MKKITLILVAFAMTLGASAQVIFGNYNTNTGVFTENGDDKIGLGLNYHCLTFAVQVDSYDMLAVLDTDERLVAAFAAIRNGANDDDKFSEGNIRMIKAPGDDNVYYIEEWDLGTIGAGSDAPHLHSEILVASSTEANEAGFEFWWDESTTAGWAPQYKYLGEYDVNNTACGVGIADVIADEMDAEIVGYYTILGQKLSGEPANGVFLVKYSNGKTVKMMK